MYKLRYILLALGIVGAILFLMVSGPLYWRLYLGNAMFTDGLYDFRYAIRVETNATMLLSVMTIGLSWLMAVVYYYLINSVKFDRWWHWAAVAVVLVLATPLLGYEIVAYKLNSLEPGLSGEYADLNMLLQVWTAALSLFWFIEASFSIRWWSSNCRHTPLPQ